MTSQPHSYRGYRFPSEIISHAVWLYHRFGLKRVIGGPIDIAHAAATELSASSKTPNRVPGVRVKRLQYKGERGCEPD